ncbi:hypothetical protein TUMEXPCC7403_23900 [Tumidithrix helvetica PCC 7403]|uniref:hypothetical protein n=1 Tax=Tumidithrix helvetica TaxID=3457545 RepID=UPI003C940FB2
MGYIIGLFVVVGICITIVQAILPIAIVIGGAYLLWKIFVIVSYKVQLQKCEKLNQQQQGWLAQQQTIAHLNQTLYRIIQKNQGRVTLLDFNLQTHQPNDLAKAFLDGKAAEYNAGIDCTDNGTIIYLFESVTHLPQPYRQPTQPLNQTKLAQRFQVAAGTIGRRKLTTDFPNWSQTKDPDRIAWAYSNTDKLFYPS